MLMTAVLIHLFATAPSEVKPLIQAFNYEGVTLDDGPLKRQCDEVRDYYLLIPNDDLLKGFRARAGKPAPGVDLGGWYSDDVFLVFGQIVSGLARLYAGTRDINCRDKANALIEEWAKCIEPDGYFYASRKPNVHHYFYDKMVGALVDVSLYCGNTNAVGYLARITEWAGKNLDRARPYGADAAEWYTLSENLYRAYLATGDQRYRDFAEVWEYTKYWDLYANQADIFGPAGVYHAYSHVNTLGGAGAAYRVTGEDHYLQTLLHAYDYLQDHQCFATGGYGPDEQLLPMEKLLPKFADTHNSFETQCGAWAAFKMTKYLMGFTGDARYGDWVERLIMNGLGASIPMTANGRVFYYSDYNTTGASKQNHPVGWTCCTGTRPMAVADYHDLIYFRDQDDVYVNLYVASTLRWKCGESEVVICQRTKFPETDTAEFTVSVAKPVTFALRFRAPGWLAKPMAAAVNGAPVDAKPDGHHWLNILREWRDKDVVTVTLPMNFWASRFCRDRAYPAAVMRGPVALAFRSTQPKIGVGGELFPAYKGIDLDHIEDSLVPSDGEVLTYHVKSDPAVLARPFYAYKEDEPYLLYLDPRAPTRISHQKVKFNGDWSDSGLFRFTRTIGNSAECAFEGAGIRWLGQAFDDAGRAEVKIDGQPVAVVDMYGPGRGLPFEWRHEDLAPGKHTITITLLPDKTPESKDHYINIIGFDILGG